MKKKYKILEAKKVKTVPQHASSTGDDSEKVKSLQKKVRDFFYNQAMISSRILSALPLEIFFIIVNSYRNKNFFIFIFTESCYMFLVLCPGFAIQELTGLCIVPILQPFSSDFCLSVVISEGIAVLQNILNCLL